MFGANGFDKHNCTLDSPSPHLVAILHAENAKDWYLFIGILENGNIRFLRFNPRIQVVISLLLGWGVLNSLAQALCNLDNGMGGPHIRKSDPPLRLDRMQGFFENVLTSQLKCKAMGGETTGRGSRSSNYPREPLKRKLVWGIIRASPNYLLMGCTVLGF